MRKYQSSNLAKYKTLNPAKKILLENFLKKIEEIVVSIKPNSVLDAGCGEGLVLTRLQKAMRAKKLIGIDLSDKALAQAEKNVRTAQFLKMDVEHLSFVNGSFDLVLMLEVLEHLDKPHLALKEARRVTRKYCVFSVPEEPWFSFLSFISGMHLRRLGRHPEHKQFWTHQEFRNFINQEFKEIRTLRVFPWTIIIAKKDAKN